MSCCRQKWPLSITVTVILLLPTVFFSYPYVDAYLRAASFLARMSNPEGKGFPAHYRLHEVDESLTTVNTPSGPVRARIYVPQNTPNAPGMVLLHGVHNMGIEEPRLRGVANAIAASGIVVLTPELKDVADYRITAGSVDVIGASAQSLRQRIGAPKVGLMGLSFSGGLALLAAADPRFESDIGFVVAVGAHHDLQRVCCFFASDEIQSPTGPITHVAAHEYGALILVYSHPEDFFPQKDVDFARECLRLQLWEKVDEARAAASKLSPKGREIMSLLLDHKKNSLKQQLLASAHKHAVDMAPVSPHGNLQGLRAPVLLLHGAGDTVIPSSETAWLKQEIPGNLLHYTLITPLLTHVDVGNEQSITDKLTLVRFMAELLHHAAQCAPSEEQAAQKAQTNHAHRHSALTLEKLFGYAG